MPTIVLSHPESRTYLTMKPHRIFRKGEPQEVSDKEAEFLLEETDGDDRPFFMTAEAAAKKVVIGKKKAAAAAGKPSDSGESDTGTVDV